MEGEYNGGGMCGERIWGKEYNGGGNIKEGGI